MLSGFTALKTMGEQLMESFEFVGKVFNIAFVEVKFWDIIKVLVASCWG